jgi:hypothetical protein
VAHTLPPELNSPQRQELILQGLRILPISSVPEDGGGEGQEGRGGYSPASDSDLTQAVRRLRDELHAGGDWHEAFGVSKQIVLLSDAQFESKEDTVMAAKLQKKFDIIGKEPTWTVWDIQIGGKLVLGAEEWCEHWAEGMKHGERIGMCKERV